MTDDERINDILNRFPDYPGDLESILRGQLAIDKAAQQRMIEEALSLGPHTIEEALQSLSRGPYTIEETIQRYLQDQGRASLRLPEELAPAEQPQPQRLAKRKTDKPKPWTETEQKLADLRQLREDAIRRTGKAPAKVASCEAAGIDPATARKHVPELWKRWRDPSYRPN